MKKKIKKVVAVILTTAMAMSVGVPAFAAGEVQPRTDGYYTSWTIESIEKNAKRKILTGEEKLCYMGQPATRPNEVAIAGGSVALDTGLSGDVKVSTAIIEAAVGCEMGITISASGSQQSAPLAVGEYVYGYISPIAVYDKITQTRIYRIDGYSTKETAVCYALTSLAVSIRLEYYSDNARTFNNEPYKIETYLIDAEGNSTLIDTEYN